jgi:hypothetical protein
MTVEERNLYALAERLHTPVYMLRNMPYSEYRGWIEYLSQPEDNGKNLLNNPAGLVAAVGAFHGD